MTIWRSNCLGGKKRIDSTDYLLAAGSYEPLAWYLLLDRGSVTLSVTLKNQLKITVGQGAGRNLGCHVLCDYLRLNKWLQRCNTCRLVLVVQVCPSEQVCLGVTNQAHYTYSLSSWLLSAISARCLACFLYSTLIVFHEPWQTIRVIIPLFV